MAILGSLRFGWRTAVVLVAAACAGTWAVGQVRNIRDSNAASAIADNMKSVCVGRFLIDVPVEADVKLSGARMSGFAIETAEEREGDFRKRVSGRELEIAARGADSDGSGEGGMVEARDLRLPGMIGRSLIYGRSRGYMMNGDRRIEMESVSIEVHAHMGDLSISLSGTSKQVSNLGDAEVLLARFQPRAAQELPVAPGFCVWRGLFAEPLPKHSNEHVTLHLGLPSHPDVGLAFDSMPAGRTDRSLLARVADVDAAAPPHEMRLVTKLRSGKRSIHGVDGEEVMERVRELNFTTGYSFMWEALGVENDHLRPYLLLNMETGTNPRPGGEPVDSSLHQDAVLALWDRISSSIRLRAAARPDTGARARTASAAHVSVPALR